MQAKQASMFGTRSGGISFRCSGGGGGFRHDPVTKSVVRPRADVMDQKDALQAMTFFDGAGEDVLEELAAVSSVRHIDKGRRVRNGSAKGDFGVIVRGRAKRTIPRGRSEGELVLDLLGDGDLVSESCMVGSERAFAGETVALEHSQVLFVPRGALERCLDRHAAIAVRFVQVLALRLARVSTLAAQNACMEAGDRLYCRLVELALVRGSHSIGGLFVEHGLTQRELAGFSAASREIVNRQLAEWRDRQWVEARRYSVLIRDPDALTQSVAPAARWVGFGAGDGRNAFRTD